MAKYVVVSWPDSQDLMGKPGFRENAYLVNDTTGIQVFGRSAYFVDKEWLAKAKGTKTDSKNNATYVIVPLPDSEELMGKPGFWKNAYLNNDVRGIQAFGMSAYFIDEEWLAEAVKDELSRRRSKKSNQ